MAENETAAAKAVQKDVDLIKKLFKDDEQTLLRNVRSLMYGIELLPDEKANIKSVFAPVEVRDLMRRRFLPDIADSRVLPLGQIQDVWLGAEQMVFAAEPLQIEQATEYKSMAIQNVVTALKLLENPDGQKPVYRVGSYVSDPKQIQLMARNMFLRHIDQQLMTLSQIANQKKELTPKEQAELNRKRSAK